MIQGLDRCAFCPHKRMSHTAESYAEMCTICREPCSYIFIPVHNFSPSLQNDHECITCRLPEKSCAHHEEFHDEKH